MPTPPPLAGHALHEAKRHLRERVLAARDALDPAVLEADSRAIAARIAGMASFRDARCLLLTLPFRSEWHTQALAGEALGRGARVVLPRVNVESRMIELFDVEDVSRDVEPGYRGIPEPRPGLPRVEEADIDWVLVPGVAFDESGRRLGYGGGFYDRLLAGVEPRVPRVAGAFELQIVDAIPAAPHDLLVNAIATPGRLVVA